MKQANKVPAQNSCSVNYTDCYYFVDIVSSKVRI